MGTDDFYTKKCNYPERDSCACRTYGVPCKKPLTIETVKKAERIMKKLDETQTEEINVNGITFHVKNKVTEKMITQIYDLGFEQSFISYMLPWFKITFIWWNDTY